MLISEFVFVEWVFCSLISVSSSVFWSLCLGLLAAGLTSDPVERESPSKLRAKLLVVNLDFGPAGDLCLSSG